MLTFRKLTRAVALTAAIVVTALVGVPSVASADPYPAPPPPLVVSDGTIVAGESVRISGTGFIPGETVNITARYDGGTAYAVMSVIADGDGSISEMIVLNRAGVVTITAMGVDSRVSVSVRVTVLDPGDMLPITGTDGGQLATVVWWGAGSLLAGVLLLFVVRRSKRDAVEPTGLG